MANLLRSDGEPVHNHLLAHLPADSFDSIEPTLERAPLILGQDLMSPGTPTDYVYFPEKGMVSLVLTLEDGKSTEVGLIGSEGLVGALSALGASQVSAEAMVQVTGSALRMPIRFLRSEAGINAPLRHALISFVQALFLQVTQSVACNSHHRLDQRLARWLLMARDCSESDELTLSHDFLSMMVGAQRPGVTIGLGALSKVGAIDTGRQHITIVNREVLENAACECYWTVKHEYERILE